MEICHTPHSISRNGKKKKKIKSLERSHFSLMEIRDSYKWQPKKYIKSLTKPDRRRLQLFNYEDRGALLKVLQASAINLNCSLMDWSNRHTRMTYQLITNCAHPHTEYKWTAATWALSELHHEKANYATKCAETDFRWMTMVAVLLKNDEAGDLFYGADVPWRIAKERDTK